MPCASVGHAVAFCRSVSCFGFSLSFFFAAVNYYFVLKIDFYS